MTNQQLWQLYLENTPSPLPYVDFSYHYLIAAALQRKVWCPPDHDRIYPNMYIILVGPAALGKGAVIKPALEILKHFKMPKPGSKQVDTEQLSPEHRAVRSAIEEANYDLAAGANKRAGNKGEGPRDKEELLLIPIAADATTFEALIRALNLSTRRKDYTVYDTVLQKNTPAVYTHASLCFCLEELSSLFKRNREDVSKLLLNTYDCGDYEYDTKHQGKDKIRRCCLNLFAGTVPSFIQQIFDESILDDGFSSRTIFIYEEKGRKKFFFRPELVEEQRKAKEDIIKHVGEVVKLYGAVDIDNADRAWLQTWIEKEEIERSNKSAKLQGYYGRKNLHLVKLAMAYHFGESLDMHMTREPFIYAMDTLHSREKSMHYALDFTGTNPVFKAAKKCIQFLGLNGEKTRRELLVELAPFLPNLTTGIDEVLEYLMTTQQIDSAEKANKAGTKIMYYFVTRDTPESI